MKVLHIFNEIKYSGAEIMYANSASLFQNSGIEMYAIATGNSIGDFEKQFLKSEIKTWHFPLTSSKNTLRYVRKMISFVKENDIDLIHIHRSDVKWIFSFIAKLSGVKSIYTVHNVFRHRKFTWIKGYLERFSARKFFGLKFQSIGESVFENELHYYKNPSIRINNWFDGNKFYPARSFDEKKEIRRNLGIPENSFILISTGGCSYVKNHHDILAAISKLSDKNDIIYLHLGCGKTEEEERKLALNLGISNEVVFLGNKENVRDYLVASDIYLMPSHFEGLSIASIEAMACGIPSVLYDSPGLRDLISNNDNGLLIKPNSTILSESINWIMKHPKESNIKALNALNFVNREFSMDKSVGQIIELYYSCIKQKK